MDEDNRNRGWYDTTERREWYRQYSVQQPRTPEQSGAKKKKKPGMKAVMLVLCVLVLIAATALIFSDRGGSDIVIERPQLSPDVTGSPSIIIPNDPFGFSDGSGGDGYDSYGDFRDFFDNYYTKSEDGSSIPRGENTGEVTMQLNSSEGLSQLSLQELYDRCIASVVGIKTYVSGSEYAWGTGIVLTEDGYILTNAHVISGSDSAGVVTQDGQEHEALLIGEDTQSDLAVLKIDVRGLSPAQFGDSDELRVGDGVAAIGNPLGEELKGTMTTGIISAINRDITMFGHKMSLLQTSAAINEGNSGGPLFNMYGQVIGITNMKMSAPLADVSIEGLGFAIPSSTAKSVVDDLISSGKVSGRPGLGITVGAIPADAASHYELPEGLYISAVEQNSDAWAQGVRAGDVLTAVNGQAVAATQDVNDIKDGFKVGDSLTLTIFRDGKTFDVEVRLVDMTSIY